MATAHLFSINRHRIGIDGQGITTLVGLSGCPLHCTYCINPRCQLCGTVLTENELLDRIKIDNLYYLATGGGVTFGGGEPLMQYKFIRAFAKIIDPRWRITIESSLNVPTKNVDYLLEVVNQWIIDIKDMDSYCYTAYTGRDNTNVFNNLNLLADKNLQSKCVIRVPLIPKYNQKIDVERSVDTLKVMGFEIFDKFTYQTNYHGE